MAFVVGILHPLNSFQVVLNVMAPAGKAELKSTLSRQLFGKVFGIYVLAAILITCYQIVDEYNHTESVINKEIANIYDTFEPAILDGLWNFNMESIHSIVKGMLKLDLVNGIEIYGSDSSMVLSLGIHAENDKEGTEQSKALSWTSKSARYNYKIIQNIKGTNKKVSLGLLVIHSNFQNIFDRVKYGIMLILISSVLKTSFLWLVFSYFIKKELSEPLLSFSKQINDINFDNIVDNRIEIKANKDNELTSLQNSFNSLLHKLSDSSVSLEKVNVELDQINMELESRVKLRTLELEESIKNLAESKKMNALALLVNGVAHEINTPLGVVVTSNSYLLNMIENIDTLSKKGSITKNDLNDFLVDAKLSTELVASNANKMSNMISRFKKISGSESEKSAVNVKDMVRLITDVFQPNFERYNVNISTEIDVNELVIMDTSAIPQILSALIENSLNHAFKGLDHGEIKLIINLEQDVINIAYFDNGCGIRELESERLFDPFYTTKRGEHSGLGLNIIYNYVVNRLQGKISCNSDNGLRFNISFPVALPTPS